MADEDKKSMPVTCIILALVLCILLMAAPTLTSWIEEYRTNVKMEYDDENYETRKKVEDTARTLISSYQADKLMYEQYKDSDDDEEREWAQQAKLRANKTAVHYNSYVLNNSFVWKDNIPEDIKDQLDIIE